MRNFHTAVVERREPFQGKFATQPFEVAWASEAIYFVKVERGEYDSVELTAQLSVDGTRWLNDTAGLMLAPGTDEAFLRLSHFGGWLRLSGNVDGACVLTVQLVLKE